ILRGVAVVGGAAGRDPEDGVLAAAAGWDDDGGEVDDVRVVFVVGEGEGALGEGEAGSGRRAGGDADSDWGVRGERGGVDALVGQAVGGAELEEWRAGGGFDADERGSAGRGRRDGE